LFSNDARHYSSHILQSNLEQIEEVNLKQAKEIEKLSAQHASLEKKSNMFKDTVKSLNEVNRAWEESYNAQSDDLVSHGMEISRLNAQVSDLKRSINSIQHTSSRFVNRQLCLQTPQGGRPSSIGPETM
jgi:chromosome segregation ATPase